MPLVRLEQLTRREADEARAWSKIDQTGGLEACWPYQGGLEGEGYGIFSCSVDGRKASVKIHRFVFLVTNGYLPQPPLLVRHLCEDRYARGDNGSRRCCNPLHLAEGTLVDNAADKVAAQRASLGNPASLDNAREVLRQQPERRAFGQRNARYTHPERTARGDRHGLRLHPEKVLRGPAHPRAKLTADVIARIDALHSQGLSAETIAPQLGLGRTTVYRVLRGERADWSWPPDGGMAPRDTR